VLAEGGHENGEIERAGRVVGVVDGPLQFDARAFWGTRLETDLCYVSERRLDRIDDGGAVDGDRHRPTSVAHGP
jgi:hypothetical protein